MRIQAEPTRYMVNLDGVPCRVWNAVTERGTPLLLYVHRLEVHPQASEADLLAFEVELEEVGAPERVAPVENLPLGADNPGRKGGRDATSTEGQGGT